MNSCVNQMSRCHTAAKMHWCDKVAAQLDSFTWETVRPGDLLLFDRFVPGVNMLRLFIGFKDGRPWALFNNGEAGFLAHYATDYLLVERMLKDD